MMEVLNTVFWILLLVGIVCICGAFGVILIPIIIIGVIMLPIIIGIALGRLFPRKEEKK